MKSSGLNQTIQNKVFGSSNGWSKVTPVGIAYAATVWTEAKQRRKNPLVKLDVSDECRTSLDWFMRTLSQHSGIHYFDPQIALARTIITTSDSSHIGAAFNTNSIFSLWLWCPCCVSKINNINTLELSTMVLGLVNGVGTESRLSNLTWHTHSKNSIFDYIREYSNNPLTNSLLRLIQTAVAVYQFTSLEIKWVPRDTISETDSMTRGEATLFTANPKTNT
jgi:hypothetical protein